jgi:hypothetical protein
MKQKFLGFAEKPAKRLMTFSQQKIHHSRFLIAVSLASQSVSKHQIIIIESGLKPHLSLESQYPQLKSWG